MAYSRGSQREPTQRNALGPSSLGQMPSFAPAGRGEQWMEPPGQSNRFMAPAVPQAMTPFTPSQGMTPATSSATSNRYPFVIGGFFVVFLAYLLYEKSIGDAAILQSQYRGVRSISDVFVAVGSAICAFLCFQT